MDHCKFVSQETLDAEGFTHTISNCIVEAMHDTVEEMGEADQKARLALCEEMVLLCRQMARLPVTEES
jgi:hypothetical protein